MNDQTTSGLTEMEPPFLHHLFHVLASQCVRVSCAGDYWCAYLAPGPPVRLRIQHGHDPEHAREFITEPVEGAVLAALSWAADLHRYEEMR